MSLPNKNYLEDDTRFEPEGGFEIVELSTQTDETQIEVCESCLSVQDILQIVGETLEECLSTISDEPTALPLTRAGLQKEIQWCTQWSAINRWCHAMNADCQSIIKHVTENFQSHVQLENELAEAQCLLSIKSREHALAVEQLANQCTDLSALIEDEIKTTSNLRKQEDILRKEYNKLQCLRAKQEEADRKKAYNNSDLKAQIRRFEATHTESKSNLRLWNANFHAHLDEIKEVEDTIIARKNDFQEQTKNTIRNIQTLLTQIQEEDDQNNQLRCIRNNLKLQSGRTAVNGNGICGDNLETATLVLQLKDQIKDARYQIQMLTIFTDNSKPHSDGGSSCSSSSGKYEFPDVSVAEMSDNKLPVNFLTDMEQQIQANEVRIKLLEALNRKFGAALQKPN